MISNNINNNINEQHVTALYPLFSNVYDVNILNDTFISIYNDLFSNYVIRSKNNKHDIKKPRSSWNVKRQILWNSRPAEHLYLRIRKLKFWIGSSISSTSVGNLTETNSKEI